MRSLADLLLGLPRPLDPRRWLAHVRRLRTAEGWVPPMLLIAAAMSLVLSGTGVDLLGGNRFLQAFRYLTLATWIVVGTITTLAVTLDGVRNLHRLCLSGMRRPRWWFELSRFIWMSLLLTVLSIPLLHVTGEPVLRQLADSLFRSMPKLYVAFIAASTVAYLVSLLTRRPRRGRAYECVQYFYWLFGVTALATALAIAIPMRAGFDPALSAIAVVAGSLLGIFVLSASKRWQKRIDRHGGGLADPTTGT